MKAIAEQRVSALEETTRVFDPPSVSERWHEEGRVDGRTYGLQSANHWKFVAYLRHPELSGKERVEQIESFLRGIAQGLEERRAERIAYGFDDDEPSPTLRCIPIPVAPIATQEPTERHSLTRVKAPPLPARKAK